MVGNHGNDQQQRVVFPVQFKEFDPVAFFNAAPMFRDDCIARITDRNTSTIAAATRQATAHNQSFPPFPSTFPVHPIATNTTAKSLALPDSEIRRIFHVKAKEDQEDEGQFGLPPVPVGDSSATLKSTLGDLRDKRSNALEGCACLSPSPAQRLKCCSSDTKIKGPQSCASSTECASSPDSQRKGPSSKSSSTSKLSLKGDSQFCYDDPNVPIYQQEMKSVEDLTFLELTQIQRIITLDISGMKRSASMASLFLRKAKKFAVSKVSRRRLLRSATRKAFGVPLKLLNEANSVFIEDLNLRVPFLVHCLVQYLSQMPIPLTPGIFRRSGLMSRVSKMKAELEANFVPGTRPNILRDLVAAHVRENDHPENRFLQYEIASLLKQFLREIPGGLIPQTVSPISLQCKQVDQVRDAFLLLPVENRQLLRYLLHFLAGICHHQDVNFMTPENMARIMVPNIFKMEATGEYQTWPEGLLARVILISQTEPLRLWQIPAAMVVPPPMENRILHPDKPVSIIPQKRAASPTLEGWGYRRLDSSESFEKLSGSNDQMSASKRRYSTAARKSWGRMGKAEEIATDTIGLLFKKMKLV